MGRLKNNKVRNHQNNRCKVFKIYRKYQLSKFKVELNFITIKI